MSAPWMPDSRPYAADTMARQTAQEAKEAAQAAASTAVSAKPVTGSATVPALALGASTQVVVTLSQEIPNAAYEPLPFLQGAVSVIGNLTIAGVVTKTSTAVTILVKAPLIAVTSGATLRVVAFRNS